MLSNTPAWERNSQKRKLEQWGDYFGHRLVLEKQFFQVALSGSSSDIWVKADCMMATLFRNHQTAQIHISAAM